MKYGICNLSIVPLRAEAADSSELVTQVLYGEVFKVLESRKKWSRIRLAFDGYEAWIDNKQFLFIEEENYNDISRQTPIVCEDLVDMVSTKDKQMLSIVMGSSLNGLKRDASQQVEQGEALSFIEESEPGDLAFFDNAEGDITHVGIIMKDNYIIHAHGKVRIDRLDHTGIFNIQTSLHTHKLRVIKRII